MKLSEKIFNCRKKAGWSQEELASRLGVSRQAVSKWETGEAEPELGKLRLLAQVFDVSIDWLLSEEAEEAPSADKEFRPRPELSEQLPGVVGRLFRRYGYLAGVYVIISGLGISLIGFLARYVSKRMFSGFDLGYGSMGMFDSSFGPSLESFAVNNPVYIMGGAILVIGIVIVIAGIALAVYLKKQSRK